MWPLFLGQPQLAPVLKNPKTTLFSQGGDAWKNIYTVAYHTVHDESFIETQAFNYPDGEHIAFADGQPLLTWILKVLGVSDVETVYAVVQLLPFVGCIIGAVLLTWLLLRLRMPLVYAILFGIGIALLSPQMTRSTGHFGLSYVFALPIVLHLLMNWTNRRSWNDVGWLVGIMVLLGQLHLYLMAAGLLLACSFMILTQWIGWKGSGLRVVTQVLALAVVSFLITKGIVDFTWPVADRPAAPYGLKAFVSAWEDLIIDRDLPWWTWFSENVSKIRKPGSFEGLGYLGVVPGLFTLYIFVKYVLIRTARIPFKTSGFTPAFHEVITEESRKYLVSLALVGLVSFIVASGILLHIPGFELILDQLGALRQFRSLGRFVWILYYSIQIVSAVVITSWVLAKADRCNKRGARELAYVFQGIPLVLALLLIVEGNKRLSSIETSIQTQSYNLDKWTDAIGASAGYQAVLPLPYFHVGSENYSALARFSQIAPSTLFSLKTGLPNMGVMMSRQSGKLSRERLGLNKPWVEIPKVLLKLDTSKPILILGQLKTMRENEEAGSAHDYKPWFSESDTLFMDSDVVLLSFKPTLSNLKKVQQNYCEFWMNSTVRASALESRVYPPLLSKAGQGLDLEFSIASSPAFQELHRWDRPKGVDSIGRETLSVSWMAFIGKDGHVFNAYELRCTDSSSGVTETVAALTPSTSVVQYVGDWAQLTVSVPPNVKGEELSLWGKTARHPGVDELSIRNLVTVPSEQSVVWKTSEGLMKDGLLFRACD